MNKALDIAKQLLNGTSLQDKLVIKLANDLARVVVAESSQSDRDAGIWNEAADLCLKRAQQYKELTGIETAYEHGCYDTMKADADALRQKAKELKDEI